MFTGQERKPSETCGVTEDEATVAGKAIQFGTTKEAPSGDSVAGTAEMATRGGPGGALLTLEGNVTLTYVRKGKKAEITADRVSVNLVTGQVVGDMEPRPQQPMPVTPGTPRAPSEPSKGVRGAGQELHSPVVGPR